MSSSRALHTQILHLSCLAALAAGQAVLLALGDRTLDLDAKITVDGWGSITPTGEKKEETDDTALPFPGVKLDGKEGIQYLNIQTADRSTLVNWCKSYRLPVSGNKSVLKDRLRGFSRDRNQWEMLKPKPRRLHRGPQPDRSGQKLARKQSADALFGTMPRPEAHGMPLAPPTVELVTQSSEQREKILQWAAKVVEENPYEKQYAQPNRL